MRASRAINGRTCPLTVDRNFWNAFAMWVIRPRSKEFRIDLFNLRKM
jgi:hypothetical protein